MSKLLKDKPFLCKILELIWCIVAIGLIIQPFKSVILSWVGMNHAATVYIALGGYIVINGVVVICYLIEEKMSKKMAMIFSIVGALLCLTAGCLLMYDWSDIPSGIKDSSIDQLIASGIFAILAAITFAVDSYLTYKS